MKIRNDSKRWIGTALTIICIGLSANKASAEPSDPYDAERGVDVLTRGPVHEAFAETITFNPEPGILVAKSPREIIEELPPDERPEGANVTWIPGYWAWDDERNDFLWVSGVWRDLPPGRQWIPGYWGQDSQGSQWTSGYWADATENEVEYLPEPPESIENGPSAAAPAPNQGWVPGSWLWHQNRYAWRPGYWAAGRADWVWIPAHYIWSPRGYVFSDGYWDHTMERRGVLFAPVYFEEEVYARPHYSYSPSFAINLTVFTDQLFVRPRYQHYYFGDYYDRRYQDSGYYSPYSYQSSRHGYDPIYEHRRWEHRQDRDWERHDRDNFEHRRDFADARPPRTLRDQRERNSSHATRPGENRIDIASAFNLLSKRNDGPQRFQKVEKSEREQLAQRGRALQNTRGERQKLETRTAAAPNNSPSKSFEPTKVKLPKPLIVAKLADQLGKGQAPPTRHKVPLADPKVVAKVRQADGKPAARREPTVKKVNLRTNAPEVPAQSKKTDAKSQPTKSEKKEKKVEPQRDPRKREPKETTNGKSKENPKDEEKSKVEPKGKP